MGSGSLVTTNEFGNYGRAQGSHVSKRFQEIRQHLRLLELVFIASVVGSLLGGDGAGDETGAVQMSPRVPTASTCTPYIELEQSEKRKDTVKQNKTKQKNCTQS